jgi:hypothetical protein
LDYLTTRTSLSPIWRGFAPGFVNYKKGCTRLAAASDKVDQLIAHDRWFSLGTPASSTTKTGRHDIAKILLIAESGVKHLKSINQSICPVQCELCPLFHCSDTVNNKHYSDGQINSKHDRREGVFLVGHCVQSCYHKE